MTGIRRETGFHELRPRLLGIAYRITGSIADAEDVVQEAWLRFQRTEAVDDMVGWLVTIVSRLALDELKRAHRRRETYVGPWLPEPVCVSPTTDPAVAAEIADSLTLAFLQLLDTLTPAERVAFLLADIFDRPYTQVALVLGRSEAASRQLASRARRRIGGLPLPRASDADAATATEFVAAMLGGDIDRLLQLVAPDVILVSDGGAEIRAARRPVVGALRVTRFLRTIGSRFGDVPCVPYPLNHGTSYAAVLDNVVLAVIDPEVADGVVRSVRIILNPAKLHRANSALDIE